MDNTMIWVTDRQGRATYLCEEWHRFTGQGPDEALGTGWLRAVHPEDREIVAEGFKEALQRQVEFMLRYRLRRADGSYVWALDAASPSFTPLTRDFIGYLGLVCKYDDNNPNMTAQTQVGAFDPGQDIAEFGPISKLDIVADYLIQAKAVSTACASDVTAAIDHALNVAAQALIQEQQSRATPSTIQ